MSNGEVPLDWPIEVHNDAVRIRLPKAVYSDLAIQKAAYRLAADLAAHIEYNDEEVLVTLVRKNADDKSSSNLLVARFLQRLNDEVLREKVAKQTQGIRELLLAQAFSRSGLVDPQ